MVHGCHPAACIVKVWFMVHGMVHGCHPAGMQLICLNIAYVPKDMSEQQWFTDVNETMALFSIKIFFEQL